MLSCFQCYKTFWRNKLECLSQAKISNLIKSFGKTGIYTAPSQLHSTVCVLTNGCRYENVASYKRSSFFSQTVTYPEISFSTFCKDLFPLLSIHEQNISKKMAKLILTKPFFKTFFQNLFSKPFFKTFFQNFLLS
jgi:hypothetical protein